MARTLADEKLANRLAEEILALTEETRSELWDILSEHLCMQCGMQGGKWCCYNSRGGS